MSVSSLYFMISNSLMICYFIKHFSFSSLKFSRSPALTANSHQLNKYKYNKNFILQMQHSQFVAEKILAGLIEKVWQQLALQKVEAMAPINIEKMNVYTFQSMVELMSKELQSSDSISTDEPANCMRIQNIICNAIPLTHVEAKPGMPESAFPLMNKSKLKRLGDQRVNLMKNNSSIMKNESIISINSQIQKNNRLKDPLNKFISLEVRKGSDSEHPDKVFNSQNQEKAVNKSIEALRTRLLFLEERQKQQARNSKVKENLLMQKQIMLKKKMKEMQKVNFDYSGELIGSINPNPQSTLFSTALIKPEFQDEKSAMKMKKKEQIKPLFKTEIPNEKLQQRYERIRLSKQLTESMGSEYQISTATKFVRNFTESESLSEGIRISESSLNFTKQNPFIRTGKNITLQEFKKEVMERKFKQFRLKTHKKPVEVNKQKILGNKRSEQQWPNSEKQENSKRRFKTVIGSEQYSEFERSRKSGKIRLNSENKQKINVSNYSLFSSVVSDSDLLTVG